MRSVRRLQPRRFFTWRKNLRRTRSTMWPCAILRTPTTRCLTRLLPNLRRAWIGILFWFSEDFARRSECERTKIHGGSRTAAPRDFVGRLEDVPDVAASERES